MLIKYHAATAAPEPARSSQVTHPCKQGLLLSSVVGQSARSHTRVRPHRGEQTLQLFHLRQVPSQTESQTQSQRERERERERDRERETERKTERVVREGLCAYGSTTR